MNIKISVIIPCYNAEKFIRQCLISILASKFTDYEVIIVDDCSTDKTLAEVKNISEHFGERLKIISTKKNSGGAGIPRNIGIKNSVGKYITFVDNDDMIFPTTLQNFFDVAENFNADVVHTEKTFIFNDFGDGKFNRADLLLQSDEPHDSFVEEVTAETKNLSERIDKYIEGKFFWLPWGKFYRRDFLLENKIDFPQIKFSEDMIFCFKCMCLAENYIRVPFAANIHRVRANSVSQKFTVRDWLGVIFTVLENLEDFMNKNKFDFQDKVMKFFIDRHFDFIRSFFANKNNFEVQKIFTDELIRQKNSRGKNILLANFCANKIGE